MDDFACYMTVFPSDRFTVTEPRYPRLARRLGGKISTRCLFFRIFLTLLGIARVVEVRVSGLPVEVLSHCGLPEEVFSAPWRT